MQSREIRKKFFDFFIKHGHQQVSSSSLIPAEDPTLLFTNAGMNQFKDLFLGKEKRSYKRATSLQKCVRAGGKHNDLGNVGFTRRHHTFFEMMGNFSFGDYFKKEAIQFAWDFLTKEMGLPADKLYPTVFEDDDDAYNLWHDMIGVPAERIYRMGAADNFWAMGDTGPCGPCSEILMDRGPEYCHITEEHECSPVTCDERFLEVWNLVFMQYNRSADGELKPLKQTGVDTGMGFERLASIMQDTDSNYETDLFMPIIRRTEELTGVDYDNASPEIKGAFRVLADHIRSSACLIADGCSPSNEGRGYVLRKIIRRAALFEKKLSDKHIFPELAVTFIDLMKEFYPELGINQDRIVKILKNEIEKFSYNLQRGLAILEGYISDNNTDITGYVPDKPGIKTISGQQAFKLYDTYGFPVELIDVFANEKGYIVDHEGFEKAMDQQRTQSGKKDVAARDAVQVDVSTEFTGYTSREEASPVISLLVKDTPVQSVKAGESCWVVCEKTPFYVECGGQVDDRGSLTFDDKEATIEGLKKIDNAVAVKITAPVDITVGDVSIARVDNRFRNETMNNHTATHLLQAALIEIFGKQVKQAGSLVTADYLRFDFTWHENLSAKQIKAAEDLVNQKIWENIQLDVTNSTLDEASKKGVIAFFGEKYNPEDVRVVAIPGFSAELCGGTHVQATGDIGSFKITEVSSLSTGTRRIVAITGPKALEMFQRDFNTVRSLSQEFKIQGHEVLEAVEKQQKQLKALGSELKQAKKELYGSKVDGWLATSETINNVPFAFVGLKDASHDDLREIAQLLLRKQPGFYVLMSNVDNRSAFVGVVAPEHADAVNLRDFSGWLNKTHEMRGGGSPKQVQGGGKPFDKNMADSIKQWLTAK